LVTRPGTEGVLAVVDLGGTTTSVVITRDGVPQFVRIIPTGGNDVTQALAAGLQTDAASADLIKRRVGLHAAGNGAATRSRSRFADVAPTVPFDDVITGDPQPVDETAARIIAETMYDQLTSIANTLNYYANTRPNDPVSGIVLSGGGAQLAGLPEAMSQFTRLGVTAGDPLSTVALASAIDAEALRLSGTEYTVALGLALGRAA
jgi:type IV pilus assembly protein PilM